MVVRRPAAKNGKARGVQNKPASLHPRGVKKKPAQRVAAVETLHVSIVGKMQREPPSFNHLWLCFWLRFGWGIA